MTPATHSPTTPSDDFQLPPFVDFSPETLGQTVVRVLTENRAKCKAIGSSPSPATWGNVVVPLQEADERLFRLWNMVTHMHGVNDIPVWREQFNALLPQVTEYWTAQGQDSQLFAKFHALRDGESFAALSRVQKRVVDLALRNFRLGGASLAQSEREQFLQIQQSLAALSAKFSENVLDSTNSLAYHVTSKTTLRGVPDTVMNAAREEAKRRGVHGWVLTLQAPCYIPVMQYAHSHALRSRLYRRYNTRASQFNPLAGDRLVDNSPLICDILKLKQESAKLLGFPTYAHLSLATKMAESPQQVEQFLLDLAHQARPYAEAELAQIEELSREMGQIYKLGPWDFAYYSEILRKRHFDYSQEEVRQYLPEARVLSGLMDLLGKLFKVRLTAIDAQLWHAQARCYKVEQMDGRLLGYVYMDLYARPEKRGGAWMDDAVARAKLMRGQQYPVAYLTCNFSAPLENRPVYFSHEEVLTLLHEWGHGLHHLLTEVDEYYVSGLRGVEWDAVELPSQFMENFGWQWSVLSAMSGSENGSLPRALFDKMLAAKNFQVGMQTLRQAELALFDMRIHQASPPRSNRDIMRHLNKVRSEVSVFAPPKWQRMPNCFTHIFAGGYDAGYYSYKWAEVLSADAFEVFAEKGDPVNTAEGEHFRQEILAVGSSRPSMESFRVFRGRDPDPKALLRQAGML